MNLDLHVGRDFELAMRMVELDPGHEVAERVDLVPLPIERRGHVDDMFQALLIGGRPRDEVQQLMRMDDVVAIFVRGFVAYAVTDTAFHVASACASRVMCGMASSRPISPVMPSEVFRVSRSRAIARL